VYLTSLKAFIRPNVSNIKDSQIRRVKEVEFQNEKRLPHVEKKVGFNYTEFDKLKNMKNVLLM
jgi:hypothetical protein